MVNVPRIERARAVAAAVCDPELPDLPIGELGLLRDVVEQDGVLTIRLAPSYSGCPAMEAIAADILTALAAAGLGPARVQPVLSPAWSSDWLTTNAHARLRAAGIAPPERGRLAPACPRCGAEATEQISEFGATACKSLWRCIACREPFEAFKCCG